MRKAYTIGALALLFSACRPSVNITTPPTAGSVNFQNYLAIGDDYTGGFTDGSLTVSGQLNSFPMRLFEQFSMIPDPKGAKGPFIQPLLNSDNGYPGPKYILSTIHSACDPTDTGILAPVRFPNYLMDPEDAKYFVSPANNGQINNIGVLGIRAIDYPVVNYAVDAATRGLPYANRFYFDPPATPLDELTHRVNNLYPTFFTMWLGMNDVLQYALYGGQGDGTGAALPLTANIYNIRDITPYGKFDTAYDQALVAAISTGATGALINIPDITALPFFNTIPSNGLWLDRYSQADSLLTYYSGELWKKVFAPGANQYIITDHNGVVRQSVPGELILQTAPRDSFLCAGWGVTTPIPDSFVLTTDEIQFIRAAVSEYNAFIRFEATRHNLAYVDMNAYFNALPKGIAFNGINYSTKYLSGGAFSIDGIHLTQRGYALIANEIIRTINNFYGATINPVDANKYIGVKYP